MINSGDNLTLKFEKFFDVGDESNSNTVVVIFGVRSRKIHKNTEISIMGARR